MLGGMMFFWIVLLAILVTFLIRQLPGNMPDGSRLSPLDILQRRYASGEIPIEDYQERKARLEQDPF